MILSPAARAPRASRQPRVTRGACACPRPGRGRPSDPSPALRRPLGPDGGRSGRGAPRRRGRAGPGGSEWPRAGWSRAARLWSAGGGPGLSMERRGGGEGGPGLGGDLGAPPTSARRRAGGEAAAPSRPHLMKRGKGGRL